MTFDDLCAAAIDPDDCRAHSGHLAERAVLIAVDEADPIDTLLAIGRKAVTGQLRAVCALAFIEDQPTIRWWERQLAEASADRALAMEAHLLGTPRGLQ